ncbi:ER protein Pkr1 domain-containing protein [Trichoderma austrokoningii]
MSSFFVELWEGIFTPGPTPTILKATNITFAALQAVLLSLLWATSSVHFVVLSALCGGLWWSINWFARELKTAQAAEAARKKREEQQQQGGGGDGDGSSDTEVEGKVARRTTRSSKRSAAASAVKASAEILESTGEVKQRAVQEPQSSASTEDEWERVSESER